MSRNQRFKVSLDFDVNSADAQKQIDNVARSLKNVQTELRLAERNIGEGLSSNYKTIADDLYKVSAAFKTAVNQDTGKLNISKFNQGLKDTGTSLAQLSRSFGSAGAVGVQAFSQLTKSIYDAEVPIKSTNKLIDDLWITLKNTAKWQLSSSIVHGLMGGLQTAYGYAQDLNESLNNIRIVTGYGIEQMAEFAVQANKAAKALSTTTTEYTNASLIYYQQGLSAEEVQKRTDITVKMANVARQSAEVVSDQMTAVWNNFYDGTKSLEYYADVMTALGAKTASSTDEIAGGLEKFAAIGDTIGLSFDYAASALATITSNTRQSEEVVGTALKTIFARIQGLNLGETLDDGTSLNKYSEALQKVGINIFDQSGELKTMDSLLDEMGSKWSSLSKDQQTALAQTVAGVRQYTQLIALMDNWNSGDNDSFQANLLTTQTSKGALQEQADIYAEGWEAASDRVKAATEGLFDTIIDEEAFISLFNGLADVVELFDHFVQSIGGINSLLLVTGGLITKIAKTKISEELIRLTGPSVEQQREEIKKTQEEAGLSLQQMSKNARLSGDKRTQVVAQTEGELGQLYSKLNLKAEELTETQRESLKNRIATLEIQGKILASQAENVQEAEKELKVQERALEVERQRTLENREPSKIQKDAFGSLNHIIEQQGKAKAGQITNINRALGDSEKLTKEELNVLINGSGEELLNTAEAIRKRIQGEFKSIKTAIKEYRAIMGELGESSKFMSFADDRSDLKQIIAELDRMENSSEELKTVLNEVGAADLRVLISQIQKLEKEGGDTTTQYAQLAELIEKISNEARQKATAKFYTDTGLNQSEQSDEFLKTSENVASDTNMLAGSMKKFSKGAEEAGKVIDDTRVKTEVWQTRIVSLSSALLDFGSVVSMAGNVLDTIKDPDISGWEKFTTILTTMPMLIIEVISGFKAIKDAKVLDTTVNMLNWASEKVLAQQKLKTADASNKNAKAQEKETKSQKKDIVTNVAQSATEGSNKPGPRVARHQNMYKEIAKQNKAVESLQILAPYLATFAIAIGTIAASIAAIKEIEEWWNKNETAAQKAKESADSAAESYNKLKEAHSNLVSGFTGYENEIEGLNKLTKGTTEYREALIQANDAAYELINKYHDLEYSVNAEGLVVIDEESLKKIQEVQLEQLEAAQIDSQQAEAYARIAEAKAKQTEFLRKDIKTDEEFLSEDTGRSTGWGAGVGASAGVVGAIAGAKLGALTGMWAGPIGAAIVGAIGLAVGAGVGAIVGAINQNSETEREAEAMEKLAAAYRIEGEGIFADGRLEAILDDEQLSKALRANEQETRKLVAEMAEANRLANEANRSEFEKKYGKYYEDIEDENVKEAVITYGGNRREELIQKVKDEFDETLKTGQLLSFYNKNNDNVVKKVDGKFILYDKTGKELQEVNKDFILSNVAQNYVDDYLNTFATYGNTDQARGIVSSKYSNVQSPFTPEDYHSITSLFDDAKNWANKIANSPISNALFGFFNNSDDTNKLPANFLEQLDGETQEEKIESLKEYLSVLNEWGYIDENYGSSDNLAESMFNSFEKNFDSQIQDVYNNLTGTTEQIFDDYITSQPIDVNQFGKIAQQIQDAFIHGGEDSAKQIAQLYADLGEDADEFNEVLSTIDWNTIDLHSFKNLLIDNGIELDNVDDATLEYIIALEKLTASFEESTDALYADLIKLSKLNYGDIISEEDYAKLSAEAKSTVIKAPGGGYMIVDEEMYKFYTSNDAQNKYKKKTFTEDDYNTFQRWYMNEDYSDTPLKEIVRIISSFGQEFLSNKDWQLFQGLAAEINSGKELKDVDLANFNRIAETLYKDERFNYQNIQQQIEESENLIDQAIIDNLLVKYDLVREDIKNYEDPFEGIAQARFDRGIGGAVSFYESGDNANDLSMEEFEEVQKAIADVLNINTSSVTREFINRLQSSGILKNIVSNQNFDNNIIQARDDLLNVISEEIASTFSNEETTWLKELDKNSSKEKVEEVLSSLTNVKDKGLETIISYFDLLGWEIGVGDDGKLYVKAQKSDASIFGSQILKEDDKQADKIDNVRLSETVERYKEITDSLNNLEDAYSDASKQADRLYGADRLKKLKEQNELLKQEQVLLKQKKKEAEAWLVIDRQALSTAFQDAGFELRIDEDTGNILNYTEVLTELNSQLNKQIDIRNKITDKDNAETHEKNNIEPIKKQIETIKELANAYDETQQVIVDSQNKIDDTFNEWQDNNYQQLTDKLDIKLEIEDFEMREIEYQINKLGDDIESRVELASLLFKNGENSKFDSYSDSLQHYIDLYDQIEADKNNISPEDYVEGLKQSYNGIYDNLEALQSLDEEMQHYYADTLAMGAEELGKHTAKLEHFTTVLDYYHSLITLINGEYDYDGIDKVLTGKAQTLKNELDVASSNYQMLLQQQADIQNLVDTAETEERKEFYQRELEAVSTMVDEQHEIVLAKTQEWAEAEKAIMENIVAEAAHDMEKAFTNGMGFDALNNSIERVSSNSDEYLTKTNQIYETQKLMNTAQQAIDKTTNNAAKVRLKNYQDEIKALQDKNKLTNYEIELAKARYDVLLAQIALEEAQNAKSTVRMQRDNEGNYGYVYTADQTKVAEAEMNLMDTQNELYNIRLEAANDYGQKIMDLNQQLADDLIALEKARNEGQYASEAEYQAAKDQILREYYDLYTTYSDIYTMATTEDARIQQEAWVTAYDDIISSADNWQQNVVLFTSQCETAYSNYRAIVEAESEIINEVLNSIGSSVDEVKTKSDELKTYLNDTFIPKLGDTYKAVSNLTTEYLNQKDTLTELITKSGEYVQSIGEALKAYQNFEEETNPPPSQNIESEVDDATNALIEKVTNEIDKNNKPIEHPPTSDEPISEVVEEVTNATEKLKRIAIEREILSSLPYYARFNSGGYTGEWGPQGRLAVLDEKELVLNKDDTENFMIAMDVLRSIVDTIDINALHSQIPHLSSAGILTAGSGQLEQSVSIEAHFPNVSNSNEIEEAFNNLINTASQYANRKI